MRRGPEAVQGLLLLLGVSACAARSLQDVDALARRTEARTVVLEDDISLYSPYDPLATRDFLELVRAERAEVFALFGVESAEPTVVQLHPNEGMGALVTAEGDRLRIHELAWHPEGGNLGRAWRNAFVLEVAPPQTLRLEDGRTFTSMMGASTYRDTIRHELVHVATDLLDVRNADWLTEGIAHAVEWIPLEEGRFVLEPVPSALLAAAAAPREHRSIESLLAWEQSLPPAEHDVQMRRMAFALVTFLIERERDGDVRAGFTRIAAWRPERVRAEELEWSAWLDGLGAR